jgi:hypothetical protein
MMPDMRRARNEPLAMASEIKLEKALENYCD